MPVCRIPGLDLPVLLLYDRFRQCQTDSHIILSRTFSPVESLEYMRKLRCLKTAAPVFDPKFRIDRILAV